MRVTVILLCCACAHAASVRPGFARNKAEAAEVCLPQGEKDWIDSLRCPSGERPKLHRLGPVGTRNPTDPDDPRLLQQMDLGGELPPGEPDLHMVYGWEARCGERVTTLYVDMNHCAHRVKPPAPQGFSQEN